MSAQPKHVVCADKTNKICCGLKAVRKSVLMWTVCPLGVFGRDACGRHFGVCSERQLTVISCKIERKDRRNERVGCERSALVALTQFAAGKCSGGKFIKSSSTILT